MRKVFKKYLLILFISMLIPSDFENVNVLDITSKTELKKYMKSISKDLGVKCKFCHNMNDKSIDTPHKEIAREMIILTRQINKHLHSLHKDKEEENVTITCWTCHKGKTEVEPKRTVEE